MSGLAIETRGLGKAYQPHFWSSKHDALRGLDLAVEPGPAPQDILAVGFLYSAGTTGVYRIDPSTGLATPLNDTYGWQRPTGITVSSAGDIYVADAGACAGGTCTGGEIVHVDPVSGTATPLSSGGFIAGEMDVTYLPEPGPLWLLLSGVGGVLVLHRLRRSRTR